MLRTKYSLASVMAVVALVAVDCALLGTGGGADDYSVIRATALVLVGNILAIGQARYLARRGRPQPFLAGFELTGLAAMALLSLFPRLGSVPLGSVEDWFFRHLWDPRVELPAPQRGWYGQVLAFTSLGVLPSIIFATPLLIVSVLGGWLSRRFATDLLSARRTP